MLRCEWYVGRAYSNRVVCEFHDRPEQDGRPRKIVWTERPRSEWIVVPVPRLIDDDLFARVQQRVEENRRFAERRLKRKSTYLLKGLLKCGACGRTYVGHTVTTFPKKWGFPEHRYYMCNRYGQAVPGEARCKNRLLVAGADEIVWTTVRDLLIDNDALVEQLKSWLNRTTADPTGTERLSQTTARLDEMNRQRERLIDAYQAGALDLGDFQPRKSAIEDRILAVEQEQADLQSWAARGELAVRQVASAEAIVAKLRAHLTDPDFKTKQTILRLVVEKVVVAGYRLEIHLALPVSGSFDLTYVWGARRFALGIRLSARLTHWDA